MKVYNISTLHTRVKEHWVVAESPSEAEKLVLAKYKKALIIQIILYSEHALIQTKN